MSDEQGTGFKETVYREVGSVMGALAEPSRLELLELLAQCERSVEDVARTLGAKINTVSHHLHVLLDRKLVRSRKEGRRVYYSATTFGVRLWSAVVELAASELSEVKVAMQELLESGDRVEPVDYPKLLERLADNEVVLVDVRPREEYEAGHVPGAVSLPIEELREQLDSLPKDKEVVAYCRGRYCALSYEAVRWLQERGFSAWRVAEGVAEWKASGYELEPEASVRS